MSDNNEEEKGYNPFDKGSIDKILDRREKAKHKEAIRAEEIEEYKKSVNRLFASPDGQYFLKKLIRYSAIHSFDNELNPAKLVEDRGKKKVYLELIRPFLHRSITAEVEN